MDLTFSPWLVWFLAGIAVMLAELAVPGFVIIFFGLGCWGASVVAFFSPNSYSAQVAVFVIVSVASLMTLRRVAMRVFVGRSEGQETEDMGNVPCGGADNPQPGSGSWTGRAGAFSRNHVGRRLRRSNPCRV